MKYKVLYFPWIELILFFAASTLFIYAYFDGLHIGFVIILEAVTYFSTLGFSHLILLKDFNVLFLTFNPFSRSHRINYRNDKTSVKITSNQEFDMEYSAIGDSVYWVFRKSYHIEYFDKENRKRKFQLKMFSQKKEIQLFTLLSGKE